MRKILYVFVFGILLLSSCVRTDNDEQNSEHPLSIRDARMFFDEFKNDLRLGANNSSGTRSIADDPLAGIQPDWTQARYSELLGEEVVEVPFEGIAFTTVFVSDTTNLAPPPNTAVKLIAGLDSYGQIYYQIVRISCTWTYLETHNILTLTINDLDNNFSGIINRYEINGEFIGGIVVNKGNIAGIVKPHNQQQSAPSKMFDLDIWTDGNGCLNFGHTEDRYFFLELCWLGLTNISVHYETNVSDFSICPTSPGGSSGGSGGGGGFVGGLGGTLGDMGGTPGGGNGGTPPVAPPALEPSDDCQNMKKKFSDSTFVRMINILANAANTSNDEDGRMYKLLQGGYIFSSNGVTPGTNGESVGFNITYPVDGVIHTHPTWGLPIFSPGDMYLLGKSILLSSNTSNTFMVGLIHAGSDNVFFLKVGDLNTFRGFTNRLNLGMFQEKLVNAFNRNENTKMSSNTSEADAIDRFTTILASQEGFGQTGTGIDLIQYNRTTSEITKHTTNADGGKVEQKLNCN